ncbi:MAG: hypothetical protein Q6L58_12005, partial [Thermostichales cyanobacterium BF3_bins_165]
DPLSKVVTPLLNVSVSTAYVELGETELEVKEGNLFHHTFPLKALGRAERTTWQWYMGLGLHTDFQGLVAPITSTENLVLIPLLTPTEVFLPLLGPLGLQVTCRRLIVSLVEPDGFLTVFNQGRVDPQAGPTTVTIE